MSPSHRKPTPGLVPRRTAAERLAEVLGGAAFSPIESGALPDPRDRALANGLVTTALRRHGHLNQIITTLMARGLPKRSGLFEPVLRLGLTELLFRPGAEPHAALFLAGEVLKTDRRGAGHAKLLNAVLRNAQRQAEAFQNLDPALLIPDWLRTKWQRLYGENALAAFAKALLAPPPLDLSLKADDPELIEALKGQKTLSGALRLVARDRPVSELPGYAEGAWWVQDIAATLAARLITVPDGARVLDMCAAPGGKTAQLAHAGYHVSALDIDSERMLRLENNLTRIGYKIERLTEDGTAYAAPAPFEAILLDAPCSATGTFRRHPELLWHRAPADIANRAGLQRRLVANAARNLAPGGTLIYCTCSLEPEEGEDQANWIAASGLGLVPDPVDAEEIDNFSAPLTATGTLRTHPGQTLPGHAKGSLDGFFIARFKKQG